MRVELFLDRNNKSIEKDVNHQRTTGFEHQQLTSCGYKAKGMANHIIYTITLDIRQPLNPTYTRISIH